MNSLISRSIASLAFLLVAACSSSGGDGSGSLTSGVGQVCSGSGSNDCTSGLSCRVDTDEWISHHQCTSSCSTDNDCKNRFGSHTSCIGAGVCVASCLDTKDCPSGTRCNDEGWCANDGPGSGVPKCTGIPSSCASLGDTECAGTLGCFSEGTCGGFSSSGTEPCSYNTTDFSCREETGCTWTSNCTGSQSATTCESQPALLCKYTTGCSLIPQ